MKMRDETARGDIGLVRTALAWLEETRRDICSYKHWWQELIKWHDILRGLLMQRINIAMLRSTSLERISERRSKMQAHAASC